MTTRFTISRGVNIPETADVTKILALEPNAAAAASTTTLLQAGAVTADKTLTLPNPVGATDTVVARTTTDTLTNKTATDTSNNITATGVFSATTTVGLSAATAPTAGQVMRATGGTAAVWTADIYECVVDAAGAGNFTTIAAAITAGCTRIFIKAGTYTESADVVVPNGGALIGESPGSVTINLTGGARIVLDGSGGTIESAGTISITSGTSAVTGAGTTFTNLSVGQFILLDRSYYEIATITDNSNLTITETFQGLTLAGAAWAGQAMFSNMAIVNLIIAGSSSTGLLLQSLRHSTVENTTVQACTPNVIFSLCGFMRVIGLISRSSVGVGITFIASINVSMTASKVYNSTGTGINITSSSDSIIMDAIVVSNAGDDGINVTGTSTLIKITDSVITRSVDKGVNTDVGTTAFVIDSCTVGVCGGVGIDFDGRDNVVSNSIIIANVGGGIFCGDAGVISGNIFDTNLSAAVGGINLDADTDCVITNNVVRNNVGNGIGGINADNNSITGNRIFGSTLDGINVEVGGDNTVISSNISTGNGDAGIEVDATNCIISGNRCSGNTGEGIHIEAGGDEAIVTDNNLTGNTGTNLLIDGGATGVISANNKT